MMCSFRTVGGCPTHFQSDLELWLAARPKCSENSSFYRGQSTARAWQYIPQFSPTRDGRQVSPLVQSAVVQQVAMASSDTPSSGRQTVTLPAPSSPCTVV